MTDRYDIYIKDKVKFSDLTQHELMNMLEDLAIEYYQTGHPDPGSITTEIITED